MGKFRPGLPAAYTLDVPPVADLGDYLDEPPPALGGRAARDVPAARPAPPVLRTTPEPATVRPAPPQPVPPPAARPRVKAPRREVSMAPAVLRMSDELLDLVRRGSGQRDTTPSELFHALVLLAYEAKDAVDAHALPKRGRWGSPTARAYPVELKNAFRRALVAGVGDAAPGSADADE